MNKKVKKKKIKKDKERKEEKKETTEVLRLLAKVTDFTEEYFTIRVNTWLNWNKGEYMVRIFPSTMSLLDYFNMFL